MKHLVSKHLKQSTPYATEDVAQVMAAFSFHLSDLQVLIFEEVFNWLLIFVKAKRFYCLIVPATSALVVYVG